MKSDANAAGAKPMNRKEKLHIAREAYRAVSSIVSNVESYIGAKLRIRWNGDITVDDAFFTRDELEQKNGLKANE